mmetsp:Transcript_39291/g.85837  ORF Transcript_39291/g.85837 Transcript_39291/m.85837 type:complete len:350 (+) Transcript_39291:75-1124(+)
MAPSSKMLLVVLASLAGASASLSSASCNNGELVLLQMDVQRLGATPAALRHASKPAVGQAPDITAKLAKMNETIATVEKMIAEANVTVTDTFKSVLDLTQGFSTALAQVKSTAEAMKIVLGAETVDKVLKLVQQVTDILAPVTEKVQTYADKINATLGEILKKYYAEKELVYTKFLNAVEKVNALVPATNATSLLQQGKAKGLPEWFKKIFGMGSKSPCDQAKSAITQANGTVTEVYSMLMSLNATMYQDVLDQAVVVASDALAQAKKSFDDIMAKYGDQLPATVLDSVKKAAEKVFAVADQLQAKVDAEKAKVKDFIILAQTEATELYDASQSLADAQNSTCAAVSSR